MRLRAARTTGAIGRCEPQRRDGEVVHQKEGRTPLTRPRIGTRRHTQTKPSPRPRSAPRHPPNVHLAKVVDVGRVVDQPRHLPVDRVRRGRAHLINALQLEVDLIWQSGRGADVKGAERDPPISAQGLPKRSLGGPSPPPSPPRQTLASPPGPPASCASTTLRVGRGAGSRGS